jgi:hypothetical protein
VLLAQVAAARLVAVDKASRGACLWKLLDGPAVGEELA